MADEPISALSSTLLGLTGNEVELLDVNDTTFAASGTNKRITIQSLLNQYVVNGTNTTVVISGSGIAINAAGGNAVSSVFTRTGAVVATSGDYSVGQVTGAAPLASPTFTGTVTLPTGLTGLIKAASGVVSTATAGTDYLTPSGSGASLTGITGTQISGNISGNAASITGSITTSQISNLSSWSGSTSITTLGTIATGTIPGANVSGNISGNAASITGSITTSQVSNLSSWAGSTAITTLGTVTAGTFAGVTINQNLQPASPVTESSNAITLALASYNCFSVTLNAALTTITLTGATAGQWFRLRLQQAASGGPYAVTWFSGITWISFTVPTMPTTANAVLVVDFYATTSSTFDGYVVGASNV